MAQDLLFELGCEELPSGFVRPMADAFRGRVLHALDAAGLQYQSTKAFASPRRMALYIAQLEEEQAPVEISRRGPALAAAYDEAGEATQALKGFARSCGVDIDALTHLKTDKGTWVVYEAVAEGKKTVELIVPILQDALKHLPIAKPMRWGNEEIEFVRPVHWALLLFGQQVIKADILGLTTGRQSFGHRFHAPAAIEILTPSSYEAQLEQAYVMADFAKRRQRIVEQTNALAAGINAKPVMPDYLLEEVSSIVEWPKALLVNFDKQFLEVPAEALIASMQSHQKCFAIKDADDQLMPHFVTVSNIETSNEHLVVHGNEKVMHARLSDAAFFYNQDKKQALSAYQPQTAKVVFQKQLGSLQDKSFRVQSLLSQWLDAFDLDKTLAERAALLSKCDLMTGMVNEFPELQGLMGYYYSLNDKEQPLLAKSLYEQYLPRFSGDSLPESNLGRALSLADRLDTLAGIFAIGQKPSGEKDPFKLRRHALAVVRLLSAHTKPIQLAALIKQSIQNYADLLEIAPSLDGDIKNFILDRLQSWYLTQGFTSDLIAAALARQDEWLYDLKQRLLALKDFVLRPEAAALSAACKRVHNMLSAKAVSQEAVSVDLLTEACEKALYKAINQMNEDLKPFYRSADYQEILTRLAGLRAVVDDFFDQVMVMSDDEAIQSNRLALLAHLRALFSGVADISLLQLQSS